MGNAGWISSTVLPGACFGVVVFRDSGFGVEGLGLFRASGVELQRFRA